MVTAPKIAVTYAKLILHNTNADMTNMLRALISLAKLYYETLMVCSSIRVMQSSSAFKIISYYICYCLIIC